MDTYCWIHSTFTIPDRVNAAVGSVVPHPGVATPDQDNPEDKHYHKYYQWVCYVLFLQVTTLKHLFKLFNLWILHFRLVFSTCHDSSGRT